jgi:hypothetical protein
MTIPKNYFRDKLVLLLLSISSFVTILTVISVLLNVDSKHTTGYVLQYRPSLGLNAFSFGSFTELALNSVGFALLTAGLHTVLSIRVYVMRRHLALAILSLGILLSVLNLIVSNALLVQR